MKYREYIESKIRNFKETGGEFSLTRSPSSKEEVIDLLEILLQEVVYIRELWDDLFIACADQESRKVESREEKKFLGGQDFGH